MVLGCVLHLQELGSGRMTEEARTAENKFFEDLREEAKQKAS